MIPERTILRPNESRVWLNREECAAIAGCSTNDLFLSMLLFNGDLWVPRAAFVQWLGEVKSVEMKRADFDFHMFLALNRHRRVLERTVDLKPVRREYYRIIMDRGGSLHKFRLPDRYVRAVFSLSLRLAAYTNSLPRPNPEGKVLSC